MFSFDMTKHDRAHGQSLPDYALLFALITLACILAMTQMGGQLEAFFNTFTGHASNATVNANGG